MVKVRRWVNDLLLAYTTAYVAMNHTNTTVLPTSIRHFHLLLNSCHV
jgi:hypothetical protein